jgi:hypothetical protein
MDRAIRILAFSTQIPNDLSAIWQDAHRVCPPVRLNRVLQNHCIVLIIFGNKNGEIAIHGVCEPDPLTSDSKEVFDAFYS